MPHPDGDDPAAAGTVDELETMLRRIAQRYSMRLDVTDLHAVARAAIRTRAATAGLAGVLDDRPLKQPG